MTRAVAGDWLAQENGVGHYNQVINGHQYLLQTEWSNALAADDGLVA